MFGYFEAKQIRIELDILNQIELKIWFNLVLCSFLNQVQPWVLLIRVADDAMPTKS